MTDLELIKKALAGDDGAFERLVKKYENQIAGTVISMVGKSDVADDIGQEVFIRFYKMMGNYNGEAALGTYLTRIAINLSINELNRRKRRLNLFTNSDDSETPPAVRNTENTISKNEKGELVRNALQQLQPKFRSVIVLRLLEGYSTEETANILKVPTGTVLSRLSRAQKKLKNILAPYILEEV